MRRRSRESARERGKPVDVAPPTSVRPRLIAIQRELKSRSDQALPRILSGQERPRIPRIFFVNTGAIAIRSENILRPLSLASRLIVIEILSKDAQIQE